MPTLSHQVRLKEQAAIAQLSARAFAWVKTVCIERRAGRLVGPSHPVRRLRKQAAIAQMSAKSFAWVKTVCTERRAGPRVGVVELRKGVPRDLASTSFSAFSRLVDLRVAFPCPEEPLVALVDVDEGFVNLVDAGTTPVLPPSEARRASPRRPGAPTLLAA